MARRGLTGQLNMFDYFRNMDASASGEVEMVSLMPWEEEPEAEPEGVQEVAQESIPEVVTEPLTELVPETVAEINPKQEIEQESQPTSELVRRMKTPRASKKPKLVKSTSMPETPELLNVSEEPEIIEEPKKVRKPVKTVATAGAPVMSRSYMIDGREIEIAYINYNKVRITESGNEPEIFEFASSKEAVDYYVQRMQEFEPEE